MAVVFLREILFPTESCLRRLLRGDRAQVRALSIFLVIYQQVISSSGIENCGREPVNNNLAS